MIASAKLIFDECIPMPAVAALIKEIDENQIWDHVTLKYVEGALDSLWIPKVAIEGDWIVISADRGKHPKKNEQKLTDLCVECSVTHILLSATIHEFPTRDKIACIRELWDEILETCEADPGSRFIMRLDGEADNLYPILEKRSVAKRKRSKKS